MTSKANSDVRLVRCPKCKHVLPELVEVPIYKCGGCGAILQAKKRGKVLQGTESQAHEADPKHMNEVQNTSQNPIAEESCLDNFPMGVDSTTDDRIEPLGEISKSSQPNGSDAITCDHEIQGSSTEARTRTEEEEGKLPPYQCGAADQDKNSEISASNEIFQKNKVENTSENLITEESCIDKFPKRVDRTTDDRIESIGGIDQSSQLNGSDAITCDHEIEVSSTEARECSEDEEGKLPSCQYGYEARECSEDEEGKLPSCQYGYEARECSEDEEGKLPSCQYGAVDQDKESEKSASNEIFQKNEVDNTSENPITEESCTDKFPRRVDSTTDDRIESLGEINKSSQLNGSDAISCHEIEGLATEARAHTGEEEGKLPLDQYDAADQDKDSTNNDLNEIFQKNEVENTSENPITEESCTEKYPERVDGATDDRIESLGEINKSSQLNGSDAISCHEIEGLATEARAHTGEEEGKLPLDQYDAADQDKDSTNNDLNEIFQKNEVENTSENPITEESCTEKYPERVDGATDDRIESLGEINKSSQLNGSDAISCHEIEGLATDARAHTGEEEGKMPLYQYDAADQDKDSTNNALNDILQKNEVENTSENPITEESCTEKYPERVDSATDDRIESLGEINKSSQLNGSDAISCHEIEGLATDSRAHTGEEEGKMPLYQYDAADQDKDSTNNALNDILQKNEVENTSENPITEESCTEKYPERVDSATDDRIESLGEINKSSQLYGSDAISCHEIEGSSTEARAHTGEEEGKLPLYQYDTADQDEDSKYSASDEILSFSELNQHESNSLVPQVHDHEGDTFLSSLEIETRSRHSSSEFNCEGEKEVSENDVENATEKSSAGIETESPGSSEDNCARSKEEFENELQNTSENPSTDNEDLEKVHAGGKNSADGRREWIANQSLESIKPSEADKCEISFNQSGTEANYESGDNEKSGDVSIPNEVLSSPKLSHLDNDSTLSGYHMYESGKSLVSSPKQMAGSGYSSTRNDNEGKNEHPSQVEELDGNTENLSVLTSTNAEPLLDTAINDQIFTAKSFSSEGVSSDNLPSPHREMQQVESSMVPGFRHVSSEDTLESPSHLGKGDLGVTLRSSTSRSYYAYDDSTSSNETDYEVPDRRLQLLKRTLKDVDPNSTKVLPEKSKFTKNHVPSNELQRQLMNSRSSSHGKKHSTTKVSRWHQDELLQRARYRSPVRYTMRNETDDYHSRPLFSTYSSQAGRENSSSSNYGQNDFSALPDNPHELHRLELLRMVYELQDQLKRTQMSEGKPHKSILTIPSKGKEHHFSENRRKYSDLASRNYHEKYRRDITWLKYREFPQMVVPEDPTHNMHRVDCSCLRCYSQEQHHSAQLPSHAIYYSEEHPMTNARQTSRPHHSASSSHHSASSSRHHYASSDFSLRSQDMKSDNQWDNKHKEERIHRIAKRHFQPITGGAPIVACYYCLETLQLPAESFLFRRRCHQLKCGACSKVLKFSLENKIHVVRYDLIPRNPPPSKIAENTSLIKKSNLASAYRENDRPLAEPETSADNSESFSRSHSTGDNFSVTSRKYSSASSSMAPKESTKSESTRKSVYKNRSSVESFKSARSIMPDSENSCSESEVESPLPGSALHKLMGYSSIRRLVFQ